MQGGLPVVCFTAAGVFSTIVFILIIIKKTQRIYTIIKTQTTPPHVLWVGEWKRNLQINKLIISWCDVSVWYRERHIVGISPERSRRTRIVRLLLLVLNIIASFAGSSSLLWSHRKSTYCEENCSKRLYYTLRLCEWVCPKYHENNSDHVRSTCNEIYYVMNLPVSSRCVTCMQCLTHWLACSLWSGLLVCDVSCLSRRRLDMCT